MDFYDFFEVKLKVKEEVNRLKNAEDSELKNAVQKVTKNALNDFYKWAKKVILPAEVYEFISSEIDSFSENDLNEKRNLEILFSAEAVYIPNGKKIRTNLNRVFFSYSYDVFTKITGYEIFLTLYPNNRKKVKFDFYSDSSENKVSKEELKRRKLLKSVILETFSKKYDLTEEVKEIEYGYDDFSLETSRWTVFEK